MSPHPAAWMHEMVEAVAACMEAHSPMGAMGWRYHEEDEFAELVVYPTPVELVGVVHDGAIVIPGFSLDVQALQALFERVTALQWHAQGGGTDALGPDSGMDSVWALRRTEHVPSSLATSPVPRPSPQDTPAALPYRMRRGSAKMPFEFPIR